MQVLGRFIFALTLAREGGANQWGDRCRSLVLLRAVVERVAFCMAFYADVQSVFTAVVLDWVVATLEVEAVAYRLMVFPGVAPNQSPWDLRPVLISFSTLL